MARGFTSDTAREAAQANVRNGRKHIWTPEQAREAAKKCKNPHRWTAEEAREAGKKGAEARARKRLQEQAEDADPNV